MTVITLIGQPNVGKSSLFNRLVGERKAIVSPISGVTRDRQIERVVDEQQYIDIVDTSGWCDHPEEDIENHMNDQLDMAIELTDVCLLVVNGQHPITELDRKLAKKLYRANIPFWLIVNQCDHGDEHPEYISDFLSLSQANIHYVSCLDRYGINDLKASLMTAYANDVPQTDQSSIPITFIGKPNAGKSSLINAILREQRLIVSEHSGTTRDHISVPFTYKHQSFRLIDTAGMRKKQKNPQELEKFSTFRTLKAIMDADIVCLLIDQTFGISEQDMKLYDLCMQYQKSIIIVHTKDDIKNQKHEEYFDHLRQRSFLDIHPNISVSAVSRDGIPELFRHLIRISKAMRMTYTTSHLSQLLTEAVDAHQPPMINGRRIKLRMAHPKGIAPPHTIVVRGKQTTSLPGHYKRYLKQFFIQALGLKGCFLDLQFEQDVNPYD